MKALCNQKNNSWLVYRILLVHYRNLLTSETSWKTVKSGEIVPLSCRTMFLESVLMEEFGKSFSMWTESPFLLYQIILVSC